MARPLAVDLFCGLGGWTEGLLAEGWDVVGFDIERHAYGDHRYPAQLVLQDVRTIHGAQFRDASLIVASSPCQEFSYRAMPWKRAKALGPPVLGMELFAQAERIQREAIAAAGHFIPMVQENVRGAQPYVGRARWHYGSFYLWGDVPALMPITLGKGAVKVKTMGAGWYHPSDPRHVPGLGFNTHADRAMREEDGLKMGWSSQAGGAPMRRDDDSVKVGGARGDDWFTHHNMPEFEERATKHGGDWFSDPSSPGRQGGVSNGVKQPGISGERANGKGDRWFQDGEAAAGSKSSARKAASARIAKIPLPLARHIARVYYPQD
jgi:hypothetical protein